VDRREVPSQPRGCPFLCHLFALNRAYSNQSHYSRLVFEVRPASVGSLLRAYGIPGAAATAPFTQEGTAAPSSVGWPSALLFAAVPVQSSGTPLSFAIGTQTAPQYPGSPTAERPPSLRGHPYCSDCGEGELERLNFRRSNSATPNRGRRCPPTYLRLWVDWPNPGLRTSPRGGTGIGRRIKRTTTVDAVSELFTPLTNPTKPNRS